MVLPFSLCVTVDVYTAAYFYISDIIVTGVVENRDCDRLTKLTAPWLEGMVPHGYSVPQCNFSWHLASIVSWIHTS